MNPASANGGTLLRLEGVKKQFGDVSVLKGVDLTISRGQIHALLGGNGAGKSTLVKIISGAYKADEGTLTVAGESISARQHTVPHAQALGIAMIYQELSLVPTLSVAENLTLTREPVGRFGLINERRRKTAAAHLLDRLGTTGISLDAKVSSLSAGSAQVLEIAKALGQDPRVMVMDEPNAALSSRETARLFDVIRRLADQGVAIIYITHRLEEMFSIADWVTVLRDGRVARSAPVGDVGHDQVVRDMVGEDVELAEELTGRAAPHHGGAGRQANKAPVAELQGVSGRLLRGVDLQLWPGEVLGVVGLLGSGRSALARTISGQERTLEGSLSIGGKTVALRNALDAIRAGVALVPGDRSREGLFALQSTEWNVRLAALIAGRKLSSTELHSVIERVGLPPEYLRRPVGVLSGGTQQKAVLAKWLAVDPKVVVLDEPTAGIDVPTKILLRGVIRDLAARGVAVVLVSSELDEVRAVSDRVIVMRRGAIAAEGDISTVMADTAWHQLLEAM